MKRLTIAALLLLAIGPSLAETTAIVGATVHTVGPRGTVQDAVVIIEDGRFVSVGNEVDVPDDARVIDATGKIITPGLMTPVTQLGLFEVSLYADPDDSEQRGEETTASFDVSSAFNSRSVPVVVNRTEGLTSAVLVPTPSSPDSSGNRGHIISGLATVVSLGAGQSESRRHVAVTVALGARGAALVSGSRAIANMELRRALDEARQYASRPRQYTPERFTYSEPDLKVLSRVIDRDIPLLVDINRASDIEELIELVTNYDIEVIIRGGAEAWMVAEKLAAAEIPVVLDPTANLPGDFDKLNTRLANSVILKEAGVDISLIEENGVSHNARNIRQLAGMAVARGLSWDQGLEAITLSPAVIFGVDDVLGSIEPGKQADLVIWPADPLELTTFADQVFISGKAIDMENRQTLLRDRYLQSESSKPPAFRR